MATIYYRRLHFNKNSSSATGLARNVTPKLRPAGSIPGQKKTHTVFAATSKTFCFPAPVCATDARNGTNQTEFGLSDRRSAAAILLRTSVVTIDAAKHLSQARFGRPDPCYDPQS